jgi:branched-chain amino acid transport system substrate-binding protein
VAGHPITLDTCTTQASGATATACGNQFVQDNVVAVLAGSTGEEAQVAPPVLAAGIPWMGFNSNSGPTLSDPKAFSLTGSIASIAGGVVQYMLNKSYKSVGIWNINTPGSTQAVNGFMVPLVKKNGISPDVLTINAGTPDLTPQASAEMAKKPDLMFIIGNDTFCQSVLTALNTLRYTGPVMVIGQCVSSAAAAAIPNGFQGVLEQSGISQAPGDPETQLLRAVLAKYAPSADTGGTSLIGYVVALGFVRELKALTGDVTPASILATVTSARDVVLPLGGGLKVNCGTKPLATLPSLCSTGTLITPLTKDGKPTTYTFVDPTPLFKA